MKLYELDYDIYVEEGKKIEGLYSQATDWLDSIGLPYSKTRFGKYKKDIQRFYSDINKKNENENEIKAEFHSFLNAHSEITEIIRIYNDVSKSEQYDYIDQLKKVTSGQPFRNNTANDNSRDFAFELTMAARFIRSGFEVNLNQLADVVAKREDTPQIYVECKRIKSLSKVAKNIKKANEQLKRRLARENSKLPRGLVAINVNDLINPNSNMFVVDSIERLQNFNSENLNQFVIDHEMEFNTKKFNKVLGVFCEQINQAFLFDREVPAVANCRGVKFYQYSTNEPDINLIEMLAKDLANQNLY